MDGNKEENSISEEYQELTIQQINPYIFSRINDFQFTLGHGTMRTLLIRIFSKAKSQTTGENVQVMLSGLTP